MRVFLYSSFMSLLSYHQLSLYDLLQMIVKDSDKNALKEFHDYRTIFSWNNTQTLRCVDLLNHLRETAVKTGFSLADEAYYHCLDKFSHFPDKENNIDCRLYFQASLNKLPRGLSQLDTEQKLAHILQNQLTTHFSLSCKDRLRSMGDFSRYVWIVEGQKLTLMLPKNIVGSARKEWLETHVPDVDTRRPLEQQRVQAIIDNAFEGAGRETFSDEWLEHQADDTPLPWEYSERLNVEKLSTIVAEEKTSRIDEQRPAIKNLGIGELRKLVITAFENITNSESTDTAIATQFGLSKASYSRFAGKQWSTTMPDLWRNTAQVLVHHPVFCELIESSGLGKNVNQVTPIR